MKVCHFTSAHNSDDIRIFHKECVSLAEAGHEVYLVTAQSDGQRHKNVQLVSANSIKRGRLGRMIFTAREVYKHALALDADVYHFHDPELLRFARRLKRKGKKVIYDAHEDLPRQILGKDYLKFKGVVSRIVERYENRVSKKVDYVITATPFIAKRFLEINEKSLDVNNFPLLSEMDLQDSGSLKVPNKVCFIGGISRIRGIQELVESLAGTDIVLDLAGTIPDDFAKCLALSDGWKNVNALGFVDRKESLAIKSKSCAGIVTFLPLPNHTNAQPNKIFEYMASGIPVIGSNFPLWKIIIEENNCGICVDPSNPDDIRKGILKILNNPEMAIQMGKNGRRLVLEKYNWDIEKQKLVEIYRRL
jgi:glycosyltransferase involved in cell wall biosynthesis